MPPRSRWTPGRILSSGTRLTRRTIPTTVIRPLLRTGTEPDVSSGHGDDGRDRKTSSSPDECRVDCGEHRVTCQSITRPPVSTVADAPRCAASVVAARSSAELSTRSALCRFRVNLICHSRDASESPKILGAPEQQVAARNEGRPIRTTPAARPETRAVPAVESVLCSPLCRPAGSHVLERVRAIECEVPFWAGPSTFDRRDCGR